MDMRFDRSIAPRFLEGTQDCGVIAPQVEREGAQFSDTALFRIGEPRI